LPTAAALVDNACVDNDNTSHLRRPVAQEKQDRFPGVARSIPVQAASASIADKLADNTGKAVNCSLFAWCIPSILENMRTY